MSDLTKEKIISVNTTNATKNVKSLKTQIRELKEQLAGLEQGTAEYDRVAKELADTNQRQIEINEAMRYSNQDVGATLSSLTSISAGVIGAIQGINVVMQMFGASEEDAAKATQQLQQSMALIQSLTAIDTARKALDGLNRAFNRAAKNTTKTNELANAEEKLSQKVNKTTISEKAETAQVNLNTKAKNANTKATKTMTTGTTAARGAVTALTNGFKSLTKALLGNPFTWVLIGGAAVVTLITNLIEKNKELKKATEEQKKAEEERIRAMNNLPADLSNIENSVKWANSGMEELTNSTSDLYNEIRDVAGEIQRNDPQKKAMAWKLAFERVYTEAVKNGDKDKQRLIELTKLQYEYYRINKANYETEAEYLKAQEEALGKLYAAYANQQKASSTTKTSIVKTLKELVEEFKKLYKEILTEAFNWTTYKNIFNGFYTEADQQLEKINHLIETNDMDKALTDKFKEALDNLNQFKSTDITLDLIFTDESLQELETKLKDAEEKVRQYSSGEVKATQKALDAQKKKVNEIKLEIAAYNELAETVIKYIKTNEEYNKKYGEGATRKKTKELEAEKQIYLNYWTDILSNNPWAEINHTLDQTTYDLQKVKTELDEIKDKELTLGLSEEDGKRMKDLRAQLDALKNDNSKSFLERIKEWRILTKEINEINGKRVFNKEVTDNLHELYDRREELEKQQTDLERTLEETNHEIRMKDIEDEYEARKKNAEAEVQNLHNKRSAYGGGVEDYNTEVDALNIQLNAIVEQANYIEQYYQRVMSTVTKGSDEWVQLEIEKQAALEQIEQDGADKRVEITQAEVERKKKIHQTYMNALSSITSQISSLLGEKMNAYDADSKEYKKLQIAQATINTISGMLSAFVSGFQSGIPWPGNLALAGVLSGLVYATGRQSIENIKNESLKNNTSDAATGNFGDYDTLSYMNDIDLIDTIQDQRVYVTENDITTTQNRVQVRESEATF